jgi:hypothetical protein
MNDQEKITLAELIESKFLICSKCNKKYDKPKILPCLHSFCEGCIINISQEVHGSNSEEKSVKRLQCPLCLSFIGIPEDGATAFPENPFLHNLLDINEYKHERERECVQSVLYLFERYHMVVACYFCFTVSVGTVITHVIFAF